MIQICGSEQLARPVRYDRSCSFYTITAGPTAVLAKSIDTGGAQPQWVATSPDGHVAVVSTPGLNPNPQVQVYDNVGTDPSARGTVNGPIAYWGTTDQNCSARVCDDTHVNSNTWLSNTKLLVALQAYTSGSPNAYNGVYIYDITQTAVPPGHPDNNANCGTTNPQPTSRQRRNKPGSFTSPTSRLAQRSSHSRQRDEPEGVD